MDTSGVRLHGVACVVVCVFACVPACYGLCRVMCYGCRAVIWIVPCYGLCALSLVCMARRWGREEIKS